MKAFDVAKVSKMDTNDYILYQISKSKKYDLELVEESAELRGLEKGIEKGIEATEMNHVLNIYGKGISVEAISDLLSMPIEKVLEIIEKHAQKESE